MGKPPKKGLKEGKHGETAPPQNLLRNEIGQKPSQKQLKNWDNIRGKPLQHKLLKITEENHTNRP